MPEMPETVDGDPNGEYVHNEIRPTNISAWPPSLRCSYVKKDGMRCRKWAVRGGTVCRTHGAQLPQVKRAAEDRVERARERILGLVDPALEALEEIVKYGRVEAVRLNAAKDILDRAGLVVTRRGEVEVKGSGQRDSVDERLRSLLEARFAELEPGIDVTLQRVEDAEVVEDGTGVDSG